MKFLHVITLLLFSLSLKAQKPYQSNAAEILQDIQKLKVLGSVLYVAAHPDDENTRLIAWLANEKKVQSAYLSMTRGDGGQNLIGPEIREKLGIIRTQELLAARRIDKGKQYFTRANDFGYSKSPEETFSLWNEDRILADVVWVIRNFRPDIIITRFPQTGEGGHGHHTASAILAGKAFELAGDPSAFPEQLEYVEPWHPTRLYLNTGRWWNPNMTGDEPGVITIDVGEYNHLLGTSYSEMAAISRTQHKSQGFGSTGDRGESLEFLEHKKGTEVEKDIFNGIDISWERIGEPSIEQQITSIVQAYNPSKPYKSVETLLELRKSIGEIKDTHWKKVKLGEVDKIIKASLGLYLEPVAANPYLVPGEGTHVVMELTNRSPVPVTIKTIRWPGEGKLDSAFSIADNDQVKVSRQIQINDRKEYSIPYWLKEDAAIGFYNVSDQQQIGKGENDPVLETEVVISVYGTELNYKVPVIYKWNDPVGGELYRPVAIVPPVSLSFEEDIFLFPTQEPREVKVKIKSFTDFYSGQVKLNLPDGWEVIPENRPIVIKEKFSEEDVSFTVSPPSGESTVKAGLEASSEGISLSKTVDEITYDHIPVQTIVMDAGAEFVKLNINTNGNFIGYIEGAGDAVPSVLRELGYTVNVLSEEMVKQDLSSYDAIIMGVRVLNTNERIGFIMNDLLKYVEEGGVLVFQYNTSFRLHTENFSPYPLALGRERVTVEEAPVTILEPGHPVLNYPNKITAKDFENWVQERGLYFPQKWDEHFTPILAMHDPGEKETSGSLLITPYGKGYYVYSGISWFRQLPAGVPGAIRLFANILSLKGQTTDAK